MGDQGSLWLRAEGSLRGKAYSIEPLDSTGAGDSFLGALIYAHFVQGQSEQEALNFASAVGAMKCLRFGPRIKTTPEEVRQFMEEHR